MNPRTPAPTQETPLLYTVEEAAARLSLGRTTTAGLVKSGEIRSVLIGRLRRVPADALHEYVATLQREAS